MNNEPVLFAGLILAVLMLDVFMSGVYQLILGLIVFELGLSMIGGITLIDTLPAMAAFVAAWVLIRPGFAALSKWITKL